MSAVAVIGLGAMGSRMARRLLSAGHEVTVWNRTPKAADALVADGAILASSPADAARRSEAVVTMVSDPRALDDVLGGPSGVAAGITEPATLIQMSTVGPAALAQVATVLPPGVGLLDAPVLGSIGEAESGSLRVFVGGPDALVVRWTPLLSALGSVLHVGPVGAGSAAKLVANATLFVTLSGVGEALRLAEALGLAREAALEVLAATPLAAQAERRRSSIESGRYPTRFALSLARKDADLIAEAAAAAEVDLRTTRAASSWLADAAADGGGQQDYAAVLAYILGRRPRRDERA